MVRWDRRIALVCAVAGVLLLLTTLSFVFVDAGLSQRTTFLLFAGLALVIAYAVADPGAVVELDREIQQPVELLLGERVLARGEVVLVGRQLRTAGKGNYD